LRRVSMDLRGAGRMLYLSAADVSVGNGPGVEAL
jgi:hypothetical protein